MPATTASRPPAQNVDEFLRRRRRKKFAALAALALLLLLAGLYRIGLFDSRADYSRYDGKSFPTPQVVDARTLDLAGSRLRLIGLDPPPAPWASVAADRARQLVASAPVTLQLDPNTSRDKDGLLLVYVLLPDGRVLNEMLIQEGLARADNNDAHPRLARYAELEDRARFEKAGLWSKKKS